MLDFKDSQFDEILKQHFPDDLPITSEQTIANELDKIEKPSSKTFVNTYQQSLDNAVSALQKAINIQDFEAIESYQWNLGITLSNNLWGEWLLGWESGFKRGDKEINKVSKADSIASFSQPQASSGIFRNRPAEEAIKERINTLAKDVSDSEWEQIKLAILDSIKPQSETENPISRKELLKKINSILGDRAKKFKNRANRIARTELTFAYNAGRLDSYVRSGLVAGVKWLSIFDERRCFICASRHGIIISLDDVEGLAKMVIPAHPECRCVWSPVLKTDFDEAIAVPGRKLKERKPVKSKSWLAGAILAAILIPEELFFAGAVGLFAKKMIAKTGSAQAARASVALIIDGIGSAATKAAVKANSFVRNYSVSPNIVAPGIDLNTATGEQWRSLIPNLSNYQIEQLLRNVKRNQKGNREWVGGFEKLSKILDRDQWLNFRKVARLNNISNILHPSNNFNPSAVWVNTGGIVPKSKAKAVYNLINQNNFGSTGDLLAALGELGIDTERLVDYSIRSFDRKYPI